MRMTLLLIILLSLLIITLSGCSTIRPVHTIKFENKPCLEPLEGFNYQTCADLNVKIDGYPLTVPKGFETDLASIPRFLWAILPPQQANFVAPAILHDYFYIMGAGKRSDADAILYASLRQQGAMWLTANIIWLGVRLGGAHHFNKEAQNAGNRRL